jgi:DNA-binding CsgD family transcriptional regulator
MTPRERECAQLWVQGLTSSEIARQLFISQNTVRSHITRVYDKLGIGSRLQLRDLLAGDSPMPVVTQGIDDIARFLAAQDLAHRCSWEDAAKEVGRAWDDQRNTDTRRRYVGDAERLVIWLGVRVKPGQPSV